MISNLLTQHAEEYLNYLCLELPGRRVGQPGNQAATRWFGDKLLSFGFETTPSRFTCIDWAQYGAQLSLGGDTFDVFVSPYSLGCTVAAPLVAAATLDELTNLDASGKLLLLTGELTKEQLMPKNFIFYNPENHQQMVALLEAKSPAAILAATTRDPGLAGGIYPFPLIEDGDFNIPSAYMTAEEGTRLTALVGGTASLEIRATRSPSWGCNVTGRKGLHGGKRIVICAHIDAKDGTPGAVDNATGVIVLLLLAELLKDYQGTIPVEITALNGEDYYAASGEVQYLQDNAGEFKEMLVAVNLDAAGYHLGNTAYSLYDCPPTVAEAAHRAFSGQPGIIAGQQWYQSDHSMFIMNQCPAVALTSERFMDLTTYITHTPEDNPAIIDLHKLPPIAIALWDFIQILGGKGQIRS